MNVFKTSVVALALAAWFAGQAQAADSGAAVPDSQLGFYLRGDAGWSFLEWSGGDDDNAVAVGGGAGLVINDYLRSDVRLDWTGDYKVAPDATLDMTTLTGNLYLDIPNSTMLTPYVGAGGGYGWGNVVGGKDKDGFTYALMAGVSVGVTDNIDLDVGYRFIDIMSDGADPRAHQVLGGFRFKF